MIGSTIYRLATCASTNDVAKRLAEEGAGHGTVVIASEQTAGRGTKGRAWHSPRGLGLYASVILRPRRTDIALLPVVAGVAAVDAVRAAARIKARLKWPNDIVWRGRKLGGILAESAFHGDAPSYVVIGLGLNVRHEASDFPADIRTVSTSLRLATKAAVDTGRLEDALWASLGHWYGEFERGKRHLLTLAFESRLVFPAGSRVVVEREADSFVGTLLGLDAQARLVVECGARRLFLSPAEIVGIRRRTLSV